MRKHVSAIWLGLFFLILITRMFSGAVQILVPLWPTGTLGIVGYWATLAGLVGSRRTVAAWLARPFGVVAFDAWVVSIVAASAAIQLLPGAASAGILTLGANAFGDALFRVACWPFLIVSFAFILAPSRALAQADHPVQYRDRENASKVLLGAACVVLLYKVGTTLV
jgi:hypothetical protein